MKPPPRGKLFQEDLRTEPFWMLVACALVNKTTWEQAEPAFLEMRGKWPGPEQLAKAHLGSLRRMLRPLGLWRQRSLRLRQLSELWLAWGPPTDSTEVLTLPGCGRYAADSWAIFIEGRQDVAPKDGKLSWYVETRMEKRPRKNQTSNSEGRLNMKTNSAKKTKDEDNSQPQAKKASVVPIGQPEKPKGPQAELRMTIETPLDVAAEVADMPDITAKNIKDASCQLLVAVHFDKDPADGWKVGYSFNAITVKVRRMFEGCVICDKSLRWYLTRIRNEMGSYAKYKLQTQFKRPTSKS